MFKAERQRRILEILRGAGKVTPLELAEQLEVSEDTARRDLQDLDADGKLMRVHGGALLRTVDAKPYAERKLEAVQAKSDIARAALGLIKPGQTLFFDGGTTTLQLARLLPAGLRVTVVTNSPPIAIELAGHAAADVYVTGGRLLKESQVLTGPDTVEQIQRVRADLLFLGTCGVHRKQGVTVPHAEEAPVKRAMMKCAAETVALATQDKLNLVYPFVVAQTDELAYLIVDSGAAEDVVAKYRKHGLKVICA